MKGPGLAILLEKAKKAPPAPDSDASLEDSDDLASPEEVSSFKELLGAIKSGDAETGAAALKNFLKECGAY